MPIRHPATGEMVQPGNVASNLGSYVMANTLIELKGLLDNQLDLFAAYVYTRLSPNDDFMAYDLGGDQTFQLGLASMGDDEHDAHMVYAGARYTLPYGPYSPRFGAEYSWGSKYHMTWGSPSDTLINKLATRGQALEAYWIQPLLFERFFMLVGMIHLRQTHRGSSMGPSASAEQQVSNVYVLVDAAW